MEKEKWEKTAQRKQGVKNSVTIIADFHVKKGKIGLAY